MQSGPTTVTVSVGGAGHGGDDGEGVVAADDGAEIPGRRELVVEPAVAHQEGFARGLLPVDHAREIHARFADQPAAELDREARVGE